MTIFLLSMLCHTSFHGHNIKEKKIFHIHPSHMFSICIYMVDSYFFSLDISSAFGSLVLTIKHKLWLNLNNGPLCTWCNTTMSPGCHSYIIECITYVSQSRMRDDTWNSCFTVSFLFPTYMSGVVSPTHLNSCNSVRISISCLSTFAATACQCDR